jgi:hypothetical protein
MRYFFTFAVWFNVLGTYLGARNLIYAMHADDWSTIVLEVFMLPMGVLVAAHFVWKMRPSKEVV